MKPAFYEMPPIVRGDTWKGVSSIQISFTGGALTSLESGRLQFRREKSRGGDPELELNTESSGILILETGNPSWEVSLPKQSLELPVGENYWDLELIDSDDCIQTYLEGSIEILQDVTR